MELNEITPIRSPPMSLPIRKVHFSLKCLVFLLAACLVGTLHTLILPLYPWIPPIQFTFANHVTSLFFSLPAWVVYTRFDHQSRSYLSDKKLILICVARDTAGTFSGFLNNLAIRNIQLSIVYIITSSSLLIAAIFGRIFLNEPLSSVKMVALVFTITGMVMSAFVAPSSQDLSNGSQVLGTLYALGSAFCTGSVYVLWKKLLKVHCTTLLVTSSVNGIVIPLALSLALEKYTIAPCGLPAWVLTLCGLMNMFAFFCQNKACSYGESGVVSALSASISIILSFLWQLVIFGHRPGTMECVSGLLVIIGITFNSMITYLYKYKIFRYAI